MTMSPSVVQAQVVTFYHKLQNAVQGCYQIFQPRAQINGPKSAPNEMACHRREGLSTGDERAFPLVRQKHTMTRTHVVASWPSKICYLWTDLKLVQSQICYLWTDNICGSFWGPTPTELTRDSFTSTHNHYSATKQCRRPGPVTIEISLQRPLKRPWSQHSTVDDLDTSEMGTQKPPMFAHWMADQTMVDEVVTEPKSNLPNVKNIDITSTTVVDESVTEAKTDSEIDPSQEVQTPIEFTCYYEAHLANKAQLAK
ncbi:uncharacterized protein EDB91DRAFT_1088116 [Suillus paluster]|uniref:uncharacterized protein n=1 Tax=Suillus paluster TaxID=48578 RepID=UPI001B872E5B|nr:uncharacterized protein EDB91DRAFT_1088116 [Suillus paluster]KAG1722489.1 hypothetical protein EDB91DRAFT_1088116 [Suillus paluster]